MDRPERFDGKPQWHGGVLDEYADMESGIWGEHVEPALRDTHGWCWFIGVPEGKNHYFELLQTYKESPAWGEYHWFSSDVMDPAEVNDAKKYLDERTFRQEYQGSFESYDGAAYPYYSEIHRSERALDDRRPLCVSADFNIDPCIWELFQDSPAHTHFFDEICQKQTDIWKMCAELKKRLIGIAEGNEDNARRRRTIFYGDYTSAHRRDVSATEASWERIRREFSGWNAEYRLENNPRVLDRVGSVNARMRSADGLVRFSHSAKCVELKKDCEMLSTDDLLKSKAKVGDRSHASDAAGYPIHYEHGARKRGRLVAA